MTVALFLPKLVWGLNEITHVNFSAQFRKGGLPIPLLNIILFFSIKAKKGFLLRLIVSSHILFHSIH